MRAILVMVLGSILVQLCCFAVAAHAEESIEAKVAVNEANIAAVTDRLAIVEKMNIESRLTAIETKLAQGTNLQVTSTLGTVGLLAEVLLRRFKRNGKKDE